jgi:hypothetical protein
MAASRLADHGDRAALVLADLGFTSEGILDAPAGFVAGLADGARAAGALFLADEVQAGYGRVGPAFWRFAAAGITPDFVALGKPMGAGYPIGALITRREIADSLARDYEYFSTFAATPAAAAAGLAVLDVLANERIPERTPAVGDHLRARLRDLARQDTRLGDVRGTGLMAGLEITGPPGAQDPASRRAFARALLDALRDRHVLAGLTGPDGTVLKVRPPLIWHNGHADLFAAAVADALAAMGLPAQPERRVLVGDEGERVGGHPAGPPEDPLDEREHAPGIGAGEHDGEPRDDHDHERGEVEEGKHHVVRDRGQPLHQRQPPVEIALGIRIGVVQVNRLVIVGGGVPVVHQRQVDADPGGKPRQLEVPVEPPPGVLLPEHDHQQRAEEQRAPCPRGYRLAA